MNQTKNNASNHFADAVVRLIEATVSLTWHGALNIGKNLTKLTNLLVVSTLGFFIVKYFALKGFHLSFLNWIWPALFNGKVLSWLYNIPAKYHYWGIFLSLLWAYLIFEGSKVIREKKKFKENFESIGLTNGHGETPRLISRTIKENDEETYVFHANGIGLSRFEAKRSDLEAIFQKPIESIQKGSSPAIIVLHLSSQSMKDYITFNDLETESVLENESFYVGQSTNGIVQAKIKNLPHMLIAGSTGGGKSVFFKQTIAGLLKASPHLQVYLMDLKKGLEASDFKHATNVHIAKDIYETVKALEAISKEMEKRFKYLEAKGFKSIDPSRDKMDRIIVAVDEAGELYAEKNKFDDDYELSQRAEQLTHSLARLGRAAGIHLILATQKVNKESINTVIQENISARMCFKMNTLQGSLQVLGCKDAMDLPMIQGRGIWQFGSQQVAVQVPFIDEQTIKEICQAVKPKLFQSMLVTESLKTKSTLKENLVSPNV